MAKSALLPAIEIDVFYVEGVNVAGKVSEEGETNVDEEVSAASCNHEDTDWRD